jgi:hypothetical protein
MIFPIPLYAIDDTKKTQGVIVVKNFDHAKKLNEKNYGIFWPVQEFKSEVRRIENLLRIRSFGLDLDSETKEKQIERIRSGLIPSLVIESKAGFQPYLDCIGIDPISFKFIMEDILIPFYKADPNAKDLARILRAPGYYHCKDPADKFFVKQVYSSNVIYSETDIINFYRRFLNVEQRADQKRNFNFEFKKHSTDEGLFDRIWNTDCLQALTKISGTECVGYEVFSFRKNSRGDFNIIVNGKVTACWIDRFGKIGSSDKGGPTIAQWINWYHRDYKKTFSFMRKEFPHLWATN